MLRIRSSVVLARSSCFTILVMAAAVPLLAACGTARKLGGDEDILPDSDTIIVQMQPVNRSPTSASAAEVAGGLSGEAVLVTPLLSLKFIPADAERERLITFEWDFAGGAEPSDCTGFQPQVTLGAPALAADGHGPNRTRSYLGSLKVTLRRGDGQLIRNYHFSYGVRSAGLEIFAPPYPDAVISGSKQTFHITLYNVPSEGADYAWDLSEIGVAEDPSLAGPDVQVKNAEKEVSAAARVRVWPNGRPLDYVEGETTVSIKPGELPNGLQIIGDPYPASAIADTTQKFGVVVVVPIGREVAYIWDFQGIGSGYDPASATPEVKIRKAITPGSYGCKLRVYLVGDEDNPQDRTFTVKIGG